MKLHEWVYDRVAEVCRDREYLFLAFTRHFTAFMVVLLDAGRSEASGEYLISGIKSDLDGRLTWRLQRRLDWVGPNVLAVHWQLIDRATGQPQSDSAESFELSTGESLSPDASRRSE